MTPNHFAIELVDVTKQYSDVLAADSVSFKVRDGEFFGLLGPNGAGKTTTINMMTTILKPSKLSISNHCYSHERFWTKRKKWK